MISCRKVFDQPLKITSAYIKTFEGDDSALSILKKT